MSKSNNKNKDNNKDKDKDNNKDKDKDKNNNLNECVNSSIFSGANTNKMEEQKKKVPDVHQIDFNDNWNLSKIDNKTKLILFLQNSKFTKTLETILENEFNFNIIFEDNDKCIVYLKKSLVVVESKIIYTKIMDKLYKLLCEFYSDLSTPNIFDINPSIFDGELTILKIKYDSYVKDEELQGKVNTIIKFIYDKKKERTSQIFI